VDLVAKFGWSPPVHLHKRSVCAEILSVCSVVGLLSFLGTLSVSVNDASPCGAIHGAFANVNGNFGFLGDAGGTPGYHDGAVGQDPGATGYNNSTASAACN
jgi:hypothetical protein